MISQTEALAAISTGHAIWSPEYAEEICSVFGVSWPESLVQVYESDRHLLGVTMYHGPEDGVWSLDLVRHIAECLGVAQNARGFTGRGSQAREYASLILDKLTSP